MRWLSLRASRVGISAHVRSAAAWIRAYAFRPVPARRRILDWAGLAVVFLVGGLLLDVAPELDPDRILPPKVALIALIFAIASFQYRGMRDFVNERRAALRDSKVLDVAGQVIAMERRVAAGEASAEELAPLEDYFGRLVAWEDDLRREMREDVIPHNVALILNLLAAAGGLLVAVALDVATMYADGPRLRAASGALLVFAFFPFIAVFLRYAVALGYEVQGYYTDFAPPDG